MVVPNPDTPLRLIIQKKDKSFHNLRQTLEETTIGSAWVTCGGGKKGRGGSQTHHDNLEKGKAISPLKKKKTYVSLTTNSPPLFFPVDLSEYCLGYKSIATINCCPLIRKTSNNQKQSIRNHDLRPAFLLKRLSTEMVESSRLFNLGN